MTIRRGLIAAILLTLAGGLIATFSGRFSRTQAQDDDLFRPVDITGDLVAQDTVAMPAERDAILDGTPTVIYSEGVTDELLLSTGLSHSRFEDGCSIPLQLVVVQGSFDMTPLLPSSPQVSGTVLEASYVAFTYDVRHGFDTPILMELSYDQDGSMLKALMDNPLLPDPAVPRPPLTDADIVVEPCEPTLFPGGPADASGPVEGPWASPPPAIPTPAMGISQP